MKLEDINIVVLETTTYCNLMCPACSRVHPEEVMLDPNLRLGHLPIDLLKQKFNKDIVPNLKTVILQGDRGDAGMYPQVVELVQHFDFVGTVFLETNGSMRTPQWWAELAKFPNLTVSWSIDGLADTNHLYRINSNFNKIEANARAFIGAGGQANLKMIAFKHNQHQIDELKAWASELGFVSITIDHPRDLGPTKKMPVVKPNEPVYYLEAPDSWVQRSTDVLHPSALKDDCFFASSAKVNSKCPWLSLGKIYVSAYGDVLPCCMMHAVPTSPHVPVLETEYFKNLVGGDLSNINLHHHTLEEILDLRFYSGGLDATFNVNAHATCQRACSM